MESTEIWHDSFHEMLRYYEETSLKASTQCTECLGFEKLYTFCSIGTTLSHNTSCRMLQLNK